MNNILLFLGLAFFGLINANAIPGNSQAINGPVFYNDDGYNVFTPNSTVTFEYVGSFDNFPPFTNALNYLPASPNRIKTEFLLFTRKNPKIEHLVHYKDVNTLAQSPYNKDKKLKVLIHGFQNNRDTEWIHELKDDILKIEDVNVIIVGWGNGSVFPYYTNATANTRVVGKETSLVVSMIRRLYFPDNPRRLNVHCIGHSLGAHTCGYASSDDIRFTRITGLDPAGPLFEDTNPLVRLDPTDADLVDAIHTNGGSLISLTVSFGIVMPVGHIDFYVNGGKMQPGCPSITGVIGGAIGGADPSTEIGCSHSRAIQYFVESITSPCTFMGYKCLSQDDLDSGFCELCKNNECAPMGYFTDQYKTRGTLYLSTNAEEPFCGHGHVLELRISEDSPKTNGDILFKVKGTTNNVFKSIIGSNKDIKAGDIFRKYFVTEYDLTVNNDIELNFNKKGKPIFGSDPNAKSFNLKKLKVNNVEINEVYSSCQKTPIEDKQSVTLKVSLNDC